MALPAKENFCQIRDAIGGNTKDPKHNPVNKPFHFKSYAHSTKKISLKPYLVEIFQAYGDILEIGLHHVVDGSWFTGKGFATLCEFMNDNHFKQLTPQIQGWDADTVLHVMYSHIEPICCRCHTDEHIIGNCPVHKATMKKACFQCGSLEHLTSECPGNPRNRKRSKPNSESTRSSKAQDSATPATSPNTTSPVTSTTTKPAPNNTVVEPSGEHTANTVDSAHQQEASFSEAQEEEGPVDPLNEDYENVFDAEQDDEEVLPDDEDLHDDTEMNDFSQLPEGTP
ncbi:hypothetical protein [Parasitella parasitica]|uniref:CCHC-type domain-containing protein n=1 Tax=Parasitella parasitica TaxID=35722 RepID=A0A0B7N5D2_9FUNG|nr:hypothetical protein [Parasitella parasitica]